MNENSSVVEAHSFDYIPESERSASTSGQFRFWFMINATLITAYTGAVGPLFGMSLSWTLVAIVAGTLFGTLFQAFHGAQGPHMGLPQMIQSRVQFGSRGAIVPITAATIVPIGFAIFYIQTGAYAFTDLTGTTNLAVPQIVIGVAAIVAAIVGFKLLVKAEGIIAYVMIANLVLLTIAALVVLPFGDLFSASAVSLVGFLAQFGASAAYQIAIAPIVSDYTRYLPSRTPSVVVSASVFFGTVLSAVWIEALGAAVSLTFPDLDVVAGIHDMGNEFGFQLGTATLVIAIVVCLITAGVSFYSGTVSFLSALEAFRPLKPTAKLRAVTIAIAGGVAVLAGLTLPADTLTGFSTFLLLLGYLLIPWTAVNLTDYYLVRKGVYSISDILRSDGGIYGRWGKRGLISYAVGFVVMIPFFSTTFYTGPVAASLDGADISFVVGLLVPAGLYALLMRGHDLEAERAIVAASEISTPSADAELVAAAEA
ncbi:purine-cytosine permease family protein [Demequina salsinemoris]|uniref:purine-cytosine permease family protein n=1 Tax=Demequina salsinemoris TaxID=577470 RepID=UPI000A6A9257|nr:cytosine permease [Demequina salsinemoris]